MADNATPKKRKPRVRYKASFPQEILRISKENPYFYTDEEIAEALSVSERSVARWKQEYPEFLEAIEKIKVRRNEQVENSLLKMCLGFEAEEREIIQNPDGSQRRKILVKYVAPNVTAIIFFLKNRAKDWQDVANIEEAAARKILPHIIIPAIQEIPEP